MSFVQSLDTIDEADQFQDENVDDILNHAMQLLVDAFPGLTDDQAPDLASIPNTICELRNYILRRLKDKQVDSESLPILDDLIKINEWGLITFESQPSTRGKVKFFDGSFWSQRAYLNGLLPRNLVARLATMLHTLNDNIIVSETVLSTDPSKDYLNLFNFSKDNVPLIHGLYPMATCTKIDQTIEWHDGYSGNVTGPMCREYIDDHFFVVPPELQHEIVNSHSLVQIWSKNMSDNIFPTISRAMFNILYNIRY